MLGRHRRWCALSALAVLACHGEADEAARAEAGRVAHAVRAVRDAPNGGKRPLLLALEQTACTTPDVCALRKACRDAYGLEITALEGVAAVARATRSGAPVPDDAVKLLARSEADLGRAAALAKTCADLEGEARRRHRL